ncbi:uncharacterized protein [Rutidosis leptorrhynchoides]|uniref:uncharacterized protein n=1 Tax=Rutidosis leptorrhynchoides TaxID=125765 RepID=UPI003A99078E
MFMLKLKNFKEELKKWASSTFRKIDNEIKALQDKINICKVNFESLTPTESEIKSHEADLLQLQSRQKTKRSMLKLESGVRWTVDGDENTKYFHASLKISEKLKGLSEVNINSEWINDPLCIKEATFSTFSEKFKRSSSCSVEYISSSFSKLTELDNSQLCKVFEADEIKMAVWKCASSKAPGPYGLNFNFIRYWRILEIDVVKSIKEFFTFGNFSNGYKWVSWIIGCLESGRASVLTTKEFMIEKGLRQGNPLSPFLFTIVGESLCVALKDTVSFNIYKGATVGSHYVSLTHL